MPDNINISVNETTENVVINPSISTDVIDFNLYATRETINISVTPELTTVNINSVSGGGLVTSVNGQIGDVNIPSSDNNFTNALKTKLDGIQAGAEVNVNADWNSTSGDSQILNKPTIPSISGLATVTYVDTQDTLKVDKIAGKGLSENDFTNTLKTKLDSVQSGAEVNVNADWNSVSGDSQILNKPSIPSIAGLATTAYVDNQDALKVDKVAGKGLSANDYTTTEKNKLAGIASGAEVNVNADWNAVGTDAEIFNKPSIPSISGLATVTYVDSQDALKENYLSVPAADGYILASTTSGVRSWVAQTGGGGGGDMLKSTYDVDNSGVVDNAEAISIIGRNSTGATLYKGTIVYILGSTGNRPNFVKAQANSEAASAGTFGVVKNDISNNADGYVTVLGHLDNLDTRSGATHPFTSDTLVDGDVIYLSPTTAGYITNVKPSAPNHLVYLGNVVRTSPTNGTIVYRIQNGFELQELANVAINGVSDKQLLSYDSATSLWKNKSVTTADIADSTNKRYVTDANLTTISNQSGVNTGDETLTTIKSKLGITTLSGSNTGDQDLSGKVDKVAGKSLIADSEITRLATVTNFDNSSNVTALNNKVDKVTGKSLILDTEITRLSTVTNFDNSGNVTALNGKVDKVAGSRLITTPESTLLGNTSGVNTGDETITTIKSKLGITTLSGSNTGDQDLSGLATKVTTISTTSPLQGGGDLSANRTLSITQSNTSQSGFLSSTDWNTFNSANQAKINSAAFSGTEIKTLTLNQQSGGTITANFSIYDSMEIFYNVSTLQDRTIADGGTFEAKKCLFNQLSNLNNI